MSRLQVKAVINGKEETLVSFEAELYLKQGEKAVINRRKYLEQSNDFLSLSYKEVAAQQFLPRKENEKFTSDILFGNHD